MPSPTCQPFDTSMPPARSIIPGLFHSEWSYERTPESHNKSKKIWAEERRIQSASPHARRLTRHLAKNPHAPFTGRSLVLARDFMRSYILACWAVHSPEVFPGPENTHLHGENGVVWQSKHDFYGIETRPYTVSAIILSLTYPLPSPHAVHGVRLAITATIMRET